MSRDLIAQLGGYRAVAEALGVKSNRVSNWMHESRAIPWRFRPAIAKLARKKGVKLPEGFTG